ncbi:nucleotide-binding protein [Microbacterium xanthum]|uniref:nucleotide-binding protein n=1 Tax=Microbacterium xanthum TaxID=3079794 RepID=UPI002AD3C8A2|nr:AAA family ATPase [Microbacterium sp. KSW-48]MDZ8172501.1 AAA family ATPase [Microbacterium sp. KSW-48]
MNPDHPDHSPNDEAAENAVLDDAGNLDTHAIGLLGTSTQQVSVSLPTDHDDDDEDVIDDEVPFVHAPLGDPVSHDQVLTSASAVDLGRDGETVDVETSASAEEVFEGDLEADELPSDPAPVEAHTAEIVTDETPDEGVDEADATTARASDGAPGGFAVMGDEPEVRGAEHADPDAGDQGRTGSSAAPERAHGSPAPVSLGQDEAVTETPADAPVTAPTREPAPTTATGSVPATRWEAQHPGEPHPTGRMEEVERVQPRADVTLASKRLGEFEADRETADLLTADRLLDPAQMARSEPEGYWQQLIYALSGRRIHLGDSKKARARKELDRKIAAPLPGAARFVPVMSRKGGVGKTTVTTLLGMALADARDDRIIAVDANPDRGTLADRIGRTSGKTVRDLARVRGQVSGYSDISTIVARDETRLDVLASDADPQVSEAFSGRDYHDVASVAAHYYSIVLTDTGTGVVHSVMGATLDLADQLVLVAGLSVDEARLASETLTWLEANGYADQVRKAVVVLNSGRPGAPLVQLDQLEAHFRTRVRAVVRIPYDAHIATGSSIVFRDLDAGTRQAARDLAAVVVDGLRATPTAA